MKKVVVLKGGFSSEREISLISGAGCAEALRGEGFDVVELDPKEPDFVARLLAEKPDAAFNALHGRLGEDGCVQGLLEMLHIPYTHSGVLASALAMNKARAKDVFAAAGLPVVKSVTCTRAEAADHHLLEPPYVVKPVDEGSSVGVFIVRKGDNRPPKELSDASWALTDKLMVEEFVPGRELTVAVMDCGEAPYALAVTEITTGLEFYDYEAKYSAGGSKHTLPAPVPAEVADEAKRLAIATHVALGCRGVSRTDFRYDDTGDKPRLIILEVNNQPGMTARSLVPEQAKFCGMSYGQLCRKLVEDASCGR
ncbi:MAG: D-alanine--D-alanine ligase [Rhizomicrobium sp.]